MALTANDIPMEMPVVESYWRMLQQLTDTAKLRLAAKLTASVAEKQMAVAEDSAALTQRMLKKHCGTWAGSESSDEIMAAIRSNSSIRKPIEF